MSAPLYYSYRPDTRELAGCAYARANPRAPGEFIFPAHSTLVAPPAAAANTAAVFDPQSDAWSLAPDFRGHTWYRVSDGRPVLIQLLGDPALNGLTGQMPPPMAPREARRFHNGTWTSVPDRRGELWYAADGSIVAISELGDPTSLGLSSTPPDLRSEVEKIAAAKANAREALHGLLAQASAAPLLGYPEAETLGWAGKEHEAHVVVDSQPITFGSGLAPMLEAEVSAEQPSATDEQLTGALLARAQDVLLKATMFRSISGRIAGLRRRFLSAIDGCSSAEEAAALVEQSRLELGL